MSNEVNEIKKILTEVMLSGDSNNKLIREYSFWKNGLIAVEEGQFVVTDKGRAWLDEQRS